MIGILCFVFKAIAMMFHVDRLSYSLNALHTYTHGPYKEAVYKKRISLVNRFYLETDKNCTKSMGSLDLRVTCVNIIDVQRCYIK